MESGNRENAREAVTNSTGCIYNVRGTTQHTANDFPIMHRLAFDITQETQTIVVAYMTPLSTRSNWDVSADCMKHGVQKFLT